MFENKNYALGIFGTKNKSLILIASARVQFEKFLVLKGFQVLKTFEHIKLKTKYFYLKKTLCLRLCLPHAPALVSCQPLSFVL